MRKSQKYEKVLNLRTERKYAGRFVGLTLCICALSSAIGWFTHLRWPWVVVIAFVAVSALSFSLHEEEVRELWDPDDKEGFYVRYTTGIGTTTYLSIGVSLLLLAAGVTFLTLR